MQAASLLPAALLAALAALAALATLVTPVPASAAPLRGDIETDPTAYALSGNSLHVGIGYEHLRLDLGNFALSLPGFVHGVEGFDVAFDGYGIKLQWVFPAVHLGYRFR